jgi:hypothetical protein
MSRTESGAVRAAAAAAAVLGDAENRHGYGVHDAEDDPGEPGGLIGEVSPIIGKAPGTPATVAAAVTFRQINMRHAPAMPRGAGPPTGSAVRNEHRFDEPLTRVASMRIRCRNVRY